MELAGVRTKGLLLLSASMLCLLAVALPQRQAAGQTADEQIRNQLRDNTRALSDARTLESQFITDANGYIRSKDYANAETALRKALAIQFRQWQFPMQIINGVQTRLPATTTVVVNLIDTPQSRKQQIKTMLQGLSASLFTDLFNQADAAMRVKDYAKAFKAYSNIIAFAATMPDDKKAAQNADTAQTKLTAMLKDVQTPLDDAKALIKDGKMAEAQAMLGKFQKDNNALLNLCPGLKAQVTVITSSPDLVAWNREEAAKRGIALGDAALARQDYVNAFSYYRSVAETYGDMNIGRETAQKLAKLYADPAVTEIIHRQQADAECKALMTRADMAAGTGDVKTARETCETILKKSPDSEWARKAQEMLDKLKADAPKP